MPTRGTVALILALAVLGSAAGAARAAEGPDPEQSVGRIPPRLSFVDGQVSFWRPGAQDWVQAQINTPLAPGDELYSGSPGNVELQVGSRAFVRAWAGTQLGLMNQEPDFLQLKVTAGHASFDIRTLEPGRTVEVDTPNAVFTIEHTGYYRVDVYAERTSFITRRGGRATVTSPGGDSAAITPSEEVVIEGTGTPRIASYVAPQLDDWDRWNYARTDGLLDAVSARYVSPGVYGVRELDRYGSWRVVPAYGSVWVPAAVSVDWVPYSTGAWTLDPNYGWTWVDTAPWGWAPYHYGRWVYVDGFWAWAPGPVVVRAVYAPALVAFFGGPATHVGVGGPVVGWVALGWGEPVVPWWGPVGFARTPWWGGWGGPRVVNNVVINQTTVVNVQQITVYKNVSVHKSVVVVNQEHFGRGHIAGARVTQVDVKSLQPIHTAPQVTATPASFVPTASPGIRPPKEHLARPVVATRAPQVGSESVPGEKGKAHPPAAVTPPPRLVSPPKAEAALVSPRPPFGQGTAERPAVDRPPLPSPPKPDTAGRRERSPDGTASSVTQPGPAKPKREAPAVAPTTPQPAPGLTATPQAPGPSAPPPPTAAPAPPQTHPASPKPKRETPAAQPGTPQPAQVTGATTPQTPGTGGPPPQSPVPGAPQATRPSPASPQPPGPRAESLRPPGPAKSPGAASRAEAPPPPTRPLPGEPANRLSPGRSEMQPARGERKPPPTPAGPQPGPEHAPPARPPGS